MPECGYCKDCKWWVRLTRGNLNWGRCLRVMEPDALANVSDEGLETSEVGGCVQWEASNTYKFDQQLEGL